MSLLEQILEEKEFEKQGSIRVGDNESKYDIEMLIGYLENFRKEGATHVVFDVWSKKDRKNSFLTSYVIRDRIEALHALAEQLNGEIEALKSKQNT